MSLQINKHRGLLPLLIRDEIDASHVASRWRFTYAKPSLNRMKTQDGIPDRA